ncbi:head-tail connector protein [Pseudomonas syringae group genomosp. 3]|uniref:head-tail connector protein n=1 Tax=Pseudomonas syringae group genomosp. 3 TaxID=251701 RepID=UPI001905E5C6|nr:head-tail connector protein [Pseudomonas syringae group genomosp. 3]QQN29339.1 phage gp6-like head-tail connector protein [Pseudomonas syringae pv. maculicola]
MIELSLVKAHLRVDHDEEDVLIQGYVDAALAHVEQHCDRVLVQSDPVLPEQMAFTMDIHQAVLLLVGHWYANREAVGTGLTTVPLAVDRLLAYRKRY